MEIYLSEMEVAEVVKNDGFILTVNLVNANNLKRGERP
jgi:hypothetical protein